MKRILIIDDDEDFLEWVEAGLSREDYRIRAATTGKTGLDVLSTEGFDAAVVDLRLPDIDGFEVCRRIKEIDPAVAVILVTGVFKDPAAIEKGYRSGADDFLVKPFNYEELRIRVARLVSRDPAGKTRDGG